MLPQTHHLIINEAINRAGSWPRAFRQDILQGNDDEDVHVVPVVKWRLRAAGLTHTHVPRGYYGELGFPSAKRRCKTFLDAARREKNPARTAWWIGRACHLLGDVAVPARAQRIWHLQGDPLEAWIEKNVHTFRATSIPEIDCASADDIIEELARVAATFPADTTRTPWGRAAFHWFARGRMVETPELERQAQMMIPLAIAATKALLDGVDHG